MAASSLVVPLAGASMLLMQRLCMYVFILQQDNTQNIKPEGQQGSEALTAARNKNVSNKYKRQLTV